MDNESELLRVSQVAKILNVSKATVYTWVEHDKFPCYKFVGAIRIKRSDLVEWCKNRYKKVDSRVTYHDPEFSEYEKKVSEE